MCERVNGQHSFFADARRTMVKKQWVVQDIHSAVRSLTDRDRDDMNAEHASRQILEVRESLHAIDSVFEPSSPQNR